jgi:hypothetical protein
MKTVLKFHFLPKMTFISNPADGVTSAGNTTTSNVSGQNTLNGAITSGATTLTLADGTEFNSSGTVRINSEYITYTGKSTNDLTGLTRGAYNSTAAAHDDGATVYGTYIGTSDQSSRPDVMTSLQCSNSGTLFYDFSVDDTNWTTFPVTGFDVTAGEIHEFHTAVKGPRYYRSRFENGLSTSSTALRLSTYFGVFRQGNLPLNQTIGDDADSTVVRSVGVGRQPDGDYVNRPSDGEAFSTTTVLTAGETYTSSGDATVNGGWVDTDQWGDIEVFISADAVSAVNGLEIQFTNDTQASTPDVAFSKKYTFSQSFVDDGYFTVRVPTSLDGFRVLYTNGSTAQSSFLLVATLKVTPVTNLYTTGGALVTGDFHTEVALGKIPNADVEIHFGRNNNVDIGTTPEDVWEGGGVYAGQPLSYTPETVEVFSSSGDDDQGGTGARSFRIRGLKTETSEEYETEDFDLQGTGTSTSTNSWWRVNQGWVLTAGSSGENAGTITCRATTTTSNVFVSAQASFNQSNVCAWTVPRNRTAVLKRVFCSITRTSGANGSGLITLRAREPGGVFRSLASYDIQTGANIDDVKTGGVVLTAGTDVKLRVDSVSDNNTIIDGDLEFETIIPQ